MKVSYCSDCNSVLTKTSTGEVCLSCGTMPAYKFIDTHKNIASVVAHPPTRQSTIDIAPLKSPLKRALVPEIDSEAGISPARTKTPVTEAVRKPKAHKKAKLRRGHTMPALMIGKALVVVGLFGIVSTFGILASSKLSTSAGSAELSLVNVVHTLEGSATSRDTIRKQDINTIATALSVYHAQNGAYPKGGFEALSALLLSSPPFLAQLPNDPLVSKYPTKSYVYNSDGVRFELHAQLENSNDSQAQNGNYIIEN